MVSFEVAVKSEDGRRKGNQNFYTFRGGSWYGGDTSILSIPEAEEDAHVFEASLSRRAMFQKEVRDGKGGEREGGRKEGRQMGQAGGAAEFSPQKLRWKERTDY